MVLFTKTLSASTRFRGWLIHEPRPPLRKVFPTIVTSVHDFSTLITREPLVPSTVLPVITASRQNSARKKAPIREPVIWLPENTMPRDFWMCIVSPSAPSRQPRTITFSQATRSIAPLPGPLPAGV